MKAGKYCIKDFFVNRYVDQIIIPEIQRDYVWGYNQVTGLLNSILADFQRFQNLESPVNIPEDKQLEEAFLDFYKKRTYSSNIGFIYAYNDEEYQGKYFLIDGQQRITTIYLLLLALASNNDELSKLFEKTYMDEETIKLDYKVREASHSFISQFVPYVLKSSKSITDQSWYFNDYKHDVTIQNLFRNFNIINDFILAKEVDVPSFYKYLEDYIEFWYFDTNISEQGEELYIYMNARGEQVQSNENVKADLLSRINGTSEKNKYGKIWEDWQDIFWRKRDQNENADKGFNEFLTCIAGLQNYIKDKKVFYNPIQFRERKGVLVKDLLDTLIIEDIEKYISGLIYLEKHKSTFCASYQYSKWVDISIAEIWKLFNTEKTNWFANYSDDNRATERNRMVYLWSVLYYLSTVDLVKIDATEVFRILRIYYIRYKNFNRSVTSIKNLIILISQLTSVFGNRSNPQSSVSNELLNKEETLEEKTKRVFLYAFIDDKIIQKKYEELIWEIEDHPFNIDGSDVGAINITHIVDFNDELSVTNLKIISEKFYELFSPDLKRFDTVQNILLYYGEYWYRVSPYYYFNYEFDSWRRIIRDRPETVGNVRTTFKRFWNEFINYNGTVEQFWNEKKKNLITIVPDMDFRSMMIWYNQHIGDDMWDQGNHIAFSNGNYCGLPNYLTKDYVFKNHYTFYNIKGDLKGGEKIELSDLLPVSVKYKSPIT